VATVGTALISLVGGAIGAFGVLVMRNPMRLAVFAPGAEGYYQRCFLDPIQRNGMRVFGMIISFFGLVILTAALKEQFRSTVLSHISDGFLDLLALSFIASWGCGFVYLLVQGIRGRGGEVLFGWYRLRKQGIALGPVAMSPAITPRMRKEAAIFTVVYGVLVAVPVLTAVFNAP
jgi:hypothetical protein